MTTSDAGIAFIKEAEGFRAELYLDQGRPCIGYGCDLSQDEAAAYANREITEEQADALLRSRLTPIEGGVNAFVKVPLTQGQFDALADFAYNEGLGRLQTSTLLKKLNNGDLNGAATEFLRWDYVAGQQNAGLAARRDRELKMFVGDGLDNS